MCFHIYEHTLVHDIRPLVTYKGGVDDDTMVNPYAKPEPCCQQNDTIPPNFRCEFGHGCCYLSSRVIKCTETAMSLLECGDSVPYHTYQPAKEVYESDGPDNVFASEDEGWYPWPSINESVGKPENSDRLYAPFEEYVKVLIKKILVIEKEIEDVVLEFRDVETKYRELKRQRRCDSHDVYIRVRECTEIELCRDMREMKSRLFQLDRDLSALNTRFAVQCMALDAVARGFVGECSFESYIMLCRAYSA
ncbi:hypothetical protein VM1G_05368 [Cytospora mali]|uniref:Uncharacterized protein n=1 Tax=Cytospora mali TaxID=578113 RepID=A0A194VZK3_CYTMA|nr:hypothetical protein VM1G_05368 [Valsa mali]